MLSGYNFHNSTTDGEMTSREVIESGMKRLQQQKQRRSRRCHALQQSCFVAWLIPLVLRRSAVGVARYLSSPLAAPTKDFTAARCRVETRASCGRASLHVYAAASPPGSFTSLLPSIFCISSRSSSISGARLKTDRDDARIIYCRE